MADTLKVTVTNTTDGPKVFNGLTAAHIHAGETAGPLEVTAAELKSMRGTGWFDIKGGDAPAKEMPKDDDAPDYERDGLKDVDIHKPATSKAQLLVIAAYEGADVPEGEGATKAELIKAIEAKRAA